MLFIDTSHYHHHGNYKKAVSLYRSLPGDDTLCRSKCDDDPACNGYSMDTSRSICSLSRCNTFINVTGCQWCTFSNKLTPSSSVNCLQVPELPPSIAPCVCVCKDVNQTTEEAIERRRNELFLNKTKLSSTIRKLISAEDYRTSSKIIGTVSVIILVLLGMLIFCADICSVFIFFFKKFSTIVRLLK